MMNIDQIRKILPQQPPFLMIDRVLEWEPGKRLVALKNITINDGILNAHFPDKPMMPGSLLIETMAQGAMLLFYSTKNLQVDHRVNYVLGSVKANFFRPAVPGDQLRIETVMVKLLPNGIYMEVKVFVGEEKVCESELVGIIQK